MKTYKIYTLGCKVNQYDSGKLAKELESVGLVMARKQADLAVINSCAVTKTAMVKSGRMTKLARKENPKAKVILAGCWPKAGDIKENMAGVDLVVRAGDFKELIELISKSQIPMTKQITNSDSQNKLILNSEKSRYFIKIQDGCEQYCSYCVIPYARGKLKSRVKREVIEEIKQAVKAGYQEIVLSGIHLGLYGRSVIPASEPESRFSRTELVSGLRVKPAMTSFYSAPRNDNLSSLLKKLIKIKDLGRVRLSSIEATEVSPELIKLMASSKKICRHLHLPLQSGSDKILRLMNRPYGVKYFKDKIKEIRRTMPDVAVTTDVIVGFPGETEKDFKDTEKFIKQIKFSRLHVFPFSAHEKTPAASMPGRVNEQTKMRRAKILRELGVKLADDYRKKFKGRELEIAVERVKPGKIIGKTEFYFEVEAGGGETKSKNLKIGEMVKVRY